MRVRPFLHLYMTAIKTPRQLRQSLRHQRNALTSIQQRLHGKAVARQLMRHPWFQRARTIAVYLDNDGELQTDSIIQLSRQLNKRLVLPVLHPFRHGHLLFRDWPVNARMQPNQFRIKEPARKYAVVDTRSIDLVIAPLVGFDDRCYRIGMGGGYYDRTFSFRHVNSWRKPRLVGIAHALQQLETVDNRAWDIALDIVITEKKIFRR